MCMCVNESCDATNKANVTALKISYGIIKVSYIKGGIQAKGI